MKLTSDIKRRIVNAVLNDVPKVDYTEQIAKIVKDVAFSLLPEEVKALPPEVRDIFTWQGYFTAFPGLTLYLFTDKDDILFDILIEKLKVNIEYQNLHGRGLAQGETLQTLRSEITQCLRTCTTDKQLRDKFPEFAKYLPEETKTETENLPVVQVVEHLKAAGWKE